jgi:hypothetical protein
VFAIRAGQDGGGNSQEILPARWEQNRRKWLVIISICLIGSQIGLLGGKTICGCDVEIECIASDSENIAPSRWEVVIRELA